MIKVIKEFLPHQEAWDLACAIDTTPAHWWSHVHHYGSKGEKKHPTKTVNAYRYQRKLDDDIYKSVNGGKFTYRFHRTTKHGDRCACWECSFRNDVLLSEDFKELLREHTSLKNPVLSEQFTSAYFPGDFLGTHTDQGRGVAFIVHLSWDWRPEFGGILMAKDGDKWDSYVPSWGDLVLMELGEKGTPHLVTEVSELAPRPRLAISGWFNEGDEE